MRIDRQSGNDLAIEGRTVNKAEETAKSSPIADSVSLTARPAAVAAHASARAEHVKGIADRVKSGTYNVDVPKLANAIASDELARKKGG